MIPQQKLQLFQQMHITCSLAVLITVINIHYTSVTTRSSDAAEKLCDGLVNKPSYCNHFGVLQKGFSIISPAKINGSKPNLAGRNYVRKGTNRKIWAPIACMAPPHGKAMPFLSVNMSPANLNPSKQKKPPISTLNNMIQLPVIKKFEFFTRMRKGNRKCGM